MFVSAWEKAAGSCFNNECHFSTIWIWRYLITYSGPVSCVRYLSSIWISVSLPTSKLCPKVSKGSDLFYCLLYKTVSTHLQLRRRKLLLEYSNLIYIWQTAEIWTDVVHTRLYSVQLLPVLQWALQTIVSSFSHCFPPAGTSGPGICALLFCISKGKEWTKSTHLPLASSGGSLHYVSHCRLDWAG